MSHLSRKWTKLDRPSMRSAERVRLEIRREERTRARDEIAEIERGHRRLRLLYEISKLLIRFESAEQSTAPVLARMGEVVPVRIAILILDKPSAQMRNRMVVWHAPDVDDEHLRAAKAHAKSTYAYLRRAEIVEKPDLLDLEESSIASLLPRAPGEGPITGSDTKRFILLPLVVSGGQVFGAFELQGSSSLDESSLVFITAVVNQLAIALDRQAIVEARQQEADAGWAAADASKLESEKREAEAVELRRRYEVVAHQAVERLELNQAVTGSLREGVLAIDLEGRVTFLNRSGAEMLGVTEKDGLHGDIADILRIQRSDGTPISASESPLRRVIDTGAPVHAEAQLFAHRGGVPFPVSYTSAPLRLDGSVAGAVLVFQDILELQRSERLQRFLSDTAEAFAASLEYRATLTAVVRSTVPLVADMTFIDELRDDGRVERHEVVFADPSREVFAERVRAFAPSLTSQTPQASALRMGESVLLEEIAPERVADDEAEVQLARELGIESVMVVPLKARGRILGAMTFVAAGSGRRYASRDLAFAEEIARRAAVAIDNARLYDDAQRAVQDRDDLLAIVSHDLRNPLNTILMGATFLLGRPASEDRRIQGRRVLDATQRAAKRMNRLIGDLVDIGSIESGHLAVEGARHEVAPLLDEVMELQRASAVEKGLELHCQPPNEPAEILCDRERLLQILVNLTGNAIKFTEVGRVSICAERRDDAMVFSITDSGPGIGAEELLHVFDRYWQAKKTARLGTGLGLFIVKRLVEAHGGRVWAESTLGVGSTFYFCIPLAR